MASQNHPIARRTRPRLERETAPTGSIHAAQYLTGTPESVLWGEVLLRAIDGVICKCCVLRDPIRQRLRWR